MRWRSRCGERGRGGVKLGKMIFEVGAVKECKWLWGKGLGGKFELANVGFWLVPCARLRGKRG